MSKHPFPPVPMAYRQALSPQARTLLDHLLVHGSVTQREALIDLGVQSLTKRISELRAHFTIVSDHRKHKTTEQRYVRYFYKGIKPLETTTEAGYTHPDI